MPYQYPFPDDPFGRIDSFNCIIIIQEQHRKSMSRNSQINDRKNYHVDRQNEGPSGGTATMLHIFCGDRKSKPLEGLQRELKSKSLQYVYHEDQSELLQLLAGSNKKTVVLIYNEDANAQQKVSIPESYRSNSDQNTKIFTFPTRSNTLGLPNLASPKQVIEAISAPARTSTNKIKLSSVHSIRVSKDKSAESSKSIKMVNAGSSYQKVYYLHSGHNQYGANDQSNYDQLANSLEGEANFQSFRTAKDLERKEAPKGKKKYLVLLSTNEASMKIINTLKKSKLKHFDYMLLGHLDPNQQFLDDSIILACSDPLKHLIFLLDNGFHSYSLRNLADQYVKKVNMADSQVQPYNQPITNLFSVPQPQPVQVQAVNDYKIQNFESPKNLSKLEDTDKKKIRKIKSPAKSRINQNEVKPESTSQISHNVNIVVSQHKDQTIIENDEFRINKQGEKIMKKPSQEQNRNPSTPVFAEPKRQDFRRQDNGYQQSKFNAVSPAVQSQFLGKNSNGIQAKYRKNPSVIIQEMSDEYRGSNKESIMNLQPERKTQNGFEFYQHNQPYQETSMKKVVNKVMTAQPETYYMNSARSLDFKTNPSIPENNQNINSNASISTNHANTHTETQQNNNYVPYSSYSNNSPRVYSATPITVTTANPTTWNSNTNQGNIRTYGYQSPPKVIRKEEVTTPEQVIQTKPVQKEQVRMTFGSTSSNNSNPNTLNYRNYPLTNYNSVSSSSSYYQPPTVNYHSSNNEPYNSKIHITSGKIQQLITPVITKETHTEEVKYNSNYMSPPKLEDKTSKQYITSSLFNPDEYDQIQRDGRIVYRKKVPLDARQYTPTVNYAQKVEKEEQSSPAVRRYDPSPIRRETSPYQYTSYQDKKPQQQQIKYQYNKVVENASPRSRYEIINVPYKAEDHNLGEMIESSHKKKTATINQTTTNTSPYTTDNKNFVSVSYRNNQKNSYGVANTYKDGPGVRVYGVSHPRVEVQRAEKYEPKVEARVQVLTPSPKANLNQSNWYSRMSQLHSDGSILRRNNIRFGVKLQKKQEKLQPTNSVLQNKLVSGIYKINDLNKKMALNRIIRGEEYIDQEREKYIHINNKLNRFHFIIQEEMDYLVAIFKGHIANPHDKIDRFTGVSSLFNILKAETDGQAFDGGFIFAKAEQIAHINSQLLPEHYFTVTIQKDQEGLLQISQAHKKIKVDQLKHFPLVQKIVLDSKLYQYVAYRNNKQEIELLADKFMNSEFILEKIETQFSPEILDCYYYELPRLTRLYVLCDQQQLPKMLGLIKSYAQLNPSFNRQTCKLVCVLSNILDNDELIMSHPNVTFISNPEEIKHYKDILKYAHHQEDPYSQFLPIDNIFYYAKHAHLDQQLAKQYPGRFLAFPFSKVSELYPKIDRMQKLAARYGQKPKNYLVLHENVNAEKIRVEYFAKIFMLGKAKVIQNKVVRVMNTEELLELLKK